MMITFLIAPLLVGAATLPSGISIPRDIVTSEITARAVGTPKFINFPEGSTKPAQIKAALNNAVAFASRVQQNQGQLQQLVIKWFRDVNLEDDAYGVMSKIVKTAPMFDQITFDDEDTRDVCGGGDLAYITQYATDMPVIHVCDKAFEAPNFSTITCEKLGTKLSSKMSSLGDVLLHELTHWDKIGEDVVGGHIEDKAYGPKKCNMPKKGKLDARHNADSYRWFALDSYWTLQCKRDITVGYDEADDNANYPIDICQRQTCPIE